MGIWEIIVGAFVLIFSVIMIIVIILQEGHDSGLGTITGGADSFLKRGKAKTADALFAKITKYCAIIFFVLVVLLNALSYFGLTGRTDDKKTTDEPSVVSEVSDVSEEESTAAGADESSVASAAESSVTSAAESSVTSAAESSVASAAESSVTSAAESSVTSAAESSVTSAAESSVASAAESSATGA